MMQRAALCSLIIVLILLGTIGCSDRELSAARQPAGNEEASTPSTVTVSGAFALFPMMTVWTDAYHNLHPDVQFDVQAGGAGKGMTDVLSGAVDVAMLSREARPEELDRGAFLVPVTVDAVVGTVNANNPYLEQLLAVGLTPETARAIWMTGELSTWGEFLGDDSISDPIHLYTRSDASGAGEMWALFMGGAAQEELQGTAVNADPGLAEAVRQDPLSIGYNNVGFAYNQETNEQIAGLRVLPIDLNGDGSISKDEDFYATRPQLAEAIAAARYPFPPARSLYLVTQGQPPPLIVDFYRWILSEGQQYVTSAGYVPLNAEQLEEALDSLQP